MKNLKRWLMKPGFKVFAIVQVLMLMLVSSAMAASTLVLNAGVEGASSVTGKVTLDASATLGTGHTYQVDGGTAQALTVAGDGTFSVSVAGLSDGSHTIKVTVSVDPDGAGATAASNLTTQRSYSISAGTVAAAAFNPNINMSEIFGYVQVFWDAYAPILWLLIAIGIVGGLVATVRGLFR